jgi:hypothetical protein
MPKPLAAAARHLADILDRENDALRAMDLRRVAGLLAEKTAAFADLAACQAEPGNLALVSIGRRLDHLTQENRRLLERAMAAQQRVMGIVARAAASAGTAPVYGARGSRTRLTGPMALSTRA